MEGSMSIESSQGAFEIELPPLSFKLNIAAEQNIIDGIFVDFILLNQSSHDLSVLIWNTPLEGFYSNLFIVTDKNGEQIPYQGLVAKRGKPIAIDYQLIRAKGNVATILDLSLVYRFTPGQYQLQLNKKTLQIIENDMPASIFQCQTEALMFTVR